VLAACDIEAAAEVAYTALRDTRKPLDDRGTWRAYEDTMVLRPPRGTKGPDITVRRVFVHSTARAGAAKIARAKKLDRAREDLDRLTRGLGSRHYPDEAAVRNRLAVIGKTRRVADYLTTTTGTDPGTGKPTRSGPTTRPHSRPNQPPTAGTRCSPTSTPPRPPLPACCSASKAKKHPNADTATTRARSRSPRCFCSTTGGSPR